MQRIIETSNGTYAIEHRFLFVFWYEDICHEMGSYFETEQAAKDALCRMNTPWVRRVVNPK